MSKTYTLFSYLGSCERHGVSLPPELRERFRLSPKATVGVSADGTKAAITWKGGSTTYFQTLDPQVLPAQEQMEAWVIDYVTRFHEDDDRPGRRRVNRDLIR